METNRSIALRWFEEVWNNRNTGLVGELTTEDVVAYNLEGPEVTSRGREAFIEFHKRTCEAIPDLRFEILDTIAEGDKVVLRGQILGTHTGEQLGVKPTGNRIDVGAAVFLRFENGRIAEAWNHLDQLAFYQQLRILNVR